MKNGINMRVCVCAGLFTILAVDVCKVWVLTCVMGKSMCVYVQWSVFTCVAPEAELLALLQEEEAVGVAVTAAVDEGSAGLRRGVEVVTQGEVPTGSLLQRQ